ncbi:MAG: hypothetical protein JWM27_4750 [Gemmatimonadetes bacterium]|nr:hypothetical protein [Gemmatimonadota bacterium]
MSAAAARALTGGEYAELVRRRDAARTSAAHARDPLQAVEGRVRAEVLSEVLVLVCAHANKTPVAGGRDEATPTLYRCADCGRMDV